MIKNDNAKGESMKDWTICINGRDYTNESFDETFNRQEGELRTEQVLRIAKALGTGCAICATADE